MENTIHVLQRAAAKKINAFFAADRRQALLVTGARQVGKTTLIRNLGREAFPHFVEINFLENPAADYDVPDEVVDELDKTSHRHYSPGFYFGPKGAKQHSENGLGYVRNWEFMGIVDHWENGIAHCIQRGRFFAGDEIEALMPGKGSMSLRPEWIKNEEGEAVPSTNRAEMRYTIPCEAELPPYTLLRKKSEK